MLSLWIYIHSEITASDEGLASWVHGSAGLWQGYRRPFISAARCAHCVFLDSGIACMAAYKLCNTGYSPMRSVVARLSLLAVNAVRLLPISKSRSKNMWWGSMTIGCECQKRPIALWGSVDPVPLIPSLGRLRRPH